MPSATASYRATRTPLWAGAAAVAVAVIVNPDTTHVPLCPFHAATGKYCPLCGGLRAVHALSRGALSQALADNLLVVAVLVALPITALWLRRSDARRRPQLSRLAVGGLVATAIGFTIVRNLPFATALRPG